MFELVAKTISCAVVYAKPVVPVKLIVAPLVFEIVKLVVDVVLYLSPLLPLVPLVPDEPPPPAPNVATTLPV